MHSTRTPWHYALYWRGVKTSDFQFDLPQELIAQTPAEKRDASRLMVVHRDTGTIEHRQFRDLPEYVLPGDLFVINNTKVFPARLFGTKQGGTARIETLLLKQAGKDAWESLVKPAKRVPPGSRIVFAAGEFEAEVEESPDPSKRVLRFEYAGDFMSWLNRLGRIPLPPYIRRDTDGFEILDRERYQTVYARQAQSVAAPTAGLHFTPELLTCIPHCEITLHVGYGTFKPLSAENIEDHKMDSEHYQISAETARRIEAHRRPGSRVFAVGTTSTRTLEHVCRVNAGRIVEDSGWTDLYIYPGFEFQVVQGLVTNFHLPGSTLLLLVSALAGTELVREAYATAIEQRYRFYSYGDAMLIL